MVMTLDQLGGESASGSSRRPRAFGRTSNVWQYVESVQERLTTAAKLRSGGGVESPGDQLRRTSLDFAEGEEDDDDDDDDGDDYDDADDMPRHRQRLASHANVGLQLRRGTGIGTPNGDAPPLELLPKRKVSKALALSDSTGASRYKRSSRVRGMRSISSLPELHAPLSAAGDAGRIANGSSNTAAAGFGSAKRTLQVDSSAAAASTAAQSPSAKRSGASAFNATEIVRRIQTLGTSASTPSMALAPTLSGSSLATAGSTTTLASGDAKSALPPTTTTALVQQPQQAALSDADKLRNDFNAQPSKLYYGCSVALELFNGHLLMVTSPDGHVRVQSLAELQGPQIKGCRDRAIFTLVDLTDVHSANAIVYGDAVWLQLSVGPGDVTWEQGGVLGAKVREAPQLQALALSSTDAIRNSAQAPVVVGHPVPVKAYLPKSREDGDAQTDEIQSRVRNKGSRMLGKWIIRSAVMGSRKHNDHFVYNNDEIYLEQDWFYLGADSDAGVAVLRQLPPAAALKDVKAGAYRIERRAAWRIRLLDSASGSTGLSLAQQQMERLLFRAKLQLKQSKKMRAGQTTKYARDLHAGANFTDQLRLKIAEATQKCDAQHFARQDQRLGDLSAHLSSRADAMNRRAIARNGLKDSEVAFPSDVGYQDVNTDAGRDAQQRVTAATTAYTDNDDNERSRDDTHVCALCQSSTIGYNLCQQIASVKYALETEAATATATATARQQSEREYERTSSSSDSSSRNHRQPRRASDASSIGPDTASPAQGCDIDFAASSKRTATPGAKAAARRASIFATSVAPLQTPQQLETLAERARIVALFATEDANMRSIVAYKDKTARDAAIAHAHARMGLSPVATHFRDRFKHVGLFAAQGPILGDTQQHGIGGHFQKLHAELEDAAAAQSRRIVSGGGGRKSHSHVEQLAQELGVTDFAFDMRTCPLELPGDGFDVFGDPVVTDVDAPDPVVRTRLFPTESELALLAPVDTKAVLATYAQNRAAVLEMLDGYVELCATHMVPNLRSAMALHQRASLVEMLEFTARASEFVCARRVQVRVAQLMHAVAASDVGDFAAFDAPFDLLLTEVDATLAFVRYYRERGTSRATTKRK